MSGSFLFMSVKYAQLCFFLFFGSSTFFPITITIFTCKRKEEKEIFGQEEWVVMLTPTLMLTFLPQYKKPCFFKFPWGREGKKNEKDLFFIKFLKFFLKNNILFLFFSQYLNFDMHKRRDLKNKHWSSHHWFFVIKQLNFSLIKRYFYIFFL